MNHLFFRAIFFSVPRFVVLFVVLFALQWIDFSPLPVWTMSVLAYVAHVVVTYAAAFLTFRPHAPTMGQALSAAIVFVVMELLLEAVALVVFTVAQWSDIWRQYGWVSAAIIALYALAVFAAAAQARRHHIKRMLPEGLEG